VRNLESAVTTFDFYTFFWLLVIASVVAMAGRYIKVPYALALVVTGLAIGPSHILPQAHLEPHILFTILLPPLLFETAIHMRVNLLRLNWQPIAIYALGGTLLSTLVVDCPGFWRTHISYRSYFCYCHFEAARSWKASLHHYGS